MAQVARFQRLKFNEAISPMHQARRNPCPSPGKLATADLSRGSNSGTVRDSIVCAPATENLPNTHPAAAATGRFSVWHRDRNHSSHASGGCEASFQFRPRGEHAPRDGGFRATQNLRGLGVVQAVVNGQHNRRALFGGQFQQRILDRLVQSVPGGWCSPFKYCAETSLGTVGLEMQTPCLALTPVQAGVDRDAVKPGGKFRRAVKCADLRIGADECLLREIFGVASEPVIRNVSE